MLDLLILLEWCVSVILVVGAAVWFINSFIIEAKRDLNTVSLNAQSNIESVRKEHETAVYRNFLVPSSFPLTTGLNLSIGYRLRNGNFGDLWGAAMTNGRGKSINFAGKSASLPLLNGRAKQVVQKLKDLQCSNIGIFVPVNTVHGFTIGLAGLQASIEDILPWFLPSIPRTDHQLDILFIQSWSSIMFLNGSEKWYKLIVVCEEESHTKPNLVASNIIALSEFVDMGKEDEIFAYEPTDASDDSKQLAYITCSSNKTTSFNQMALVSSVAAFIKNFPVDQGISDRDNLTICMNMEWKHAMALQVWTKTLSVLLHGGSVSFQDEPTNMKDILDGTTLLVLPRNAELIKNAPSYLRGLRSSLSCALLSDGVFNKLGQYSKSVERLRCIYIFNEIKDFEKATDFTDCVPKLVTGTEKKLNSSQLNVLRSLFGSRIVMELYSPYSVLGAIASTNFYDYRVFPEFVEKTFTCYGPFSTSIEGKLVETDPNPDLIAEKRQGMLVIRGFTIGKPVEKERLQKAIKIVENFNGGEGWMPIFGTFGVFGKDGCFYEYK